MENKKGRLYKTFYFNKGEENKEHRRVNTDRTALFYLYT